METIVISVTNPVTGELIEGISMQLSCSIHYLENETRLSISGSAYTNLDENHNPIVISEIVETVSLPDPPPLDTTDTMLG